ncbi:MAG: hypothetical protein R8M38_06930 [Mariprofundaceae bacterium]
MAIDEVNTKLAQVALDHCEGFPFEQFANDFLASIDGTGFVPVGGTSDGGADGIYDEGLFSTDKKGAFYQISTEKNHRAKIKKTVDRLVEFGRSPQRIIYVTSQVIGTYDSEEEHLSDKHNVFIRIRDAKWVLSHLNNCEATKKAYYTHLARYTDFLRDLDKGQSLRVSQNISHPSVYVFLQQQVENKEQDKHLTKAVADSLILWALNKTDPDAGKLITREKIRESINTNLPWAKNIIGSMINDRLKVLARKGGHGGKKINHHTKDDKFCLPFETRQLIATEKANDESLRLDVTNEITSSDLLSDYEPEEKSLIAKLCLNVMQDFFEKEGLNCSRFLNEDEAVDNGKDYLIENTVSDRVVGILSESALNEEKQHEFNPILCELSRRLFYQSTSL